MITCDTSGILALMARGDRDHARVTRVFSLEPGPYLVPAAILSEVAHIAATRISPKAVDQLAADLESGALTLDSGEQDFTRIRDLLGRYKGLGLTDCAVIACAERNGGRVLTLDVRDFTAVAREGTLTIVP